MEKKEQQKEQQGFYRRPLPDVCVDFASAEGRALFAEALQASRMTCYFPLAAQFHTQSHPLPPALLFFLLIYELIQ